MTYERKTASWEWDDVEDRVYCSNCGYVPSYSFTHKTGMYCPSCGMKMRGAGAYVCKADRWRLDFEIPLPPVTKKNHQRIFKTAAGKPFIAPSKEYVDYEERAAYFIPRQHLHEGPYNVAAEFYMPTKRRVDLVNLLEALDDILVSSGLLTDDDFHHIGGHDGSRVLYDKNNPRTKVIVTTMDADELED